MLLIQPCIFTDTSQTIISACAVLHNIAIQRNQELSAADAKADIQAIDGNIHLRREFSRVVHEPLALLDRHNFIQKHFL